MEKWTDGTDPATWGPDYILVIDSLTALAEAAVTWCKDKDPGLADGRLYYIAGQNALAHIIACITGPDFATNVILTAHMKFQLNEDEISQAYPSGVGSAKNPEIPRAFNTFLLAELEGSGRAAKRVIATCLLYTSPSPRDRQKSRMPSSA